MGWRDPARSSRRVRDLSDAGDTRAVILAGGRGTRLAPYTTVLPKPLMPIGDMPIAEFLLRRLARSDVDHATLAVGHLAGLIMAYFAESGDLGLRLDYSIEQQPLGTAAPIALIDGLDDTFLVMNGDLLTDLDFTALLQTHRRTGAIATVGVYERVVRFDLGVVEAADDRITSYTEKPQHHFLVSMGVYAFEPEVRRFLSPDEHLDLPDLVARLLEVGEVVGAHRHDGYWLDIGRPDDYEQAQRD